MLTMFNRSKKFVPIEFNAHLPEIQLKISHTEQAIIRVKGLLLSNEEHVDESMFQYYKLELEALQLKLACYSSIMLTSHVALDQDTALLIESYEQELDNIYCNKDQASFYVIKLLKNDLAKIDNFKTRSEFLIALDICTKKVALQQIVAQLILEHIMIKLELTNLLSDRRVLKLKQDFDALRDYDQLKLTYKDHDFNVTFPIPSTHAILIDRSRSLPNVNLLEQLSLISKNHMNLTDEQCVMLVDVIGCAIARPYVLVEHAAKIAALTSIAKSVGVAVQARLALM